MKMKLINIDTEEYVLRYESTNDNDDIYMPLIKALFRRLSPRQKKYLIITAKDKKIIMHQELLDCYRRKDSDCLLSEEKCICNVRIKNTFTITSIETNEKHNIGSECIFNWGGVKRKLKT